MGPFGIYDNNNFKIAHINAEELAEFSFDFFSRVLIESYEKRHFAVCSKTK
jgi:hypothetical protein